MRRCNSRNPCAYIVVHCRLLIALKSSHSRSGSKSCGIKIVCTVVSNSLYNIALTISTHSRSLDFMNYQLVALWKWNFCKSKRMRKMSILLCSMARVENIFTLNKYMSPKCPVVLLLWDFRQTFHHLLQCRHKKGYFHLNLSDAKSQSKKSQRHLIPITDLIYVVDVHIVQIGPAC